MGYVRHKCYLSYHEADRALVDAFVSAFGDEREAFSLRGIRGPEDLTESNDTDFVTGEIRRRFLKDSTVTIVLLGACTWSRRFVDWEIQSSLRVAADGLPNGLMGILLDPEGDRAALPERFRSNHDSGYAGYYRFPTDPLVLAGRIDDAFAARTSRAGLIVNPRERIKFNKPCG